MQRFQMNQVTEKKTAGLPANVFEEDAAKGLGNIGQQDLALPFLKILVSHGINLNGTNSVIPPVSFCMSRIILKCLAQ